MDLLVDAKQICDTMAQSGELAILYLLPNTSVSQILPFPLTELNLI